MTGDMTKTWNTREIGETWDTCRGDWGDGRHEIYRRYKGDRGDKRYVVIEVCLI